jgi:peptidoglycan-associated lipoprotein
VVSYGEEKPAVEGSGEAVFAKNRRGVIVYQ